MINLTTTEVTTNVKGFMEAQIEVDSAMIHMTNVINSTTMAGNFPETKKHLMEANDALAAAQRSFIKELAGADDEDV